MNNDQRHAFSHCQIITNKIENSSSGRYEHCFGTIHKQLEVIQIFRKIELLRIHTWKQHILPGGLPCQDPAHFMILNFATDY